MKLRIVMCIIAGTMLFSTSAMGAGTDQALTEKPATNPKPIMFRNIPWYSTLADAETSFSMEGSVGRDGTWKDYARRLSGTEYTNVISGEDYVENGGMERYYDNMSVAGYNPSHVGACYIYTISSDGVIDRTPQNAQFYLGWYEFDSNDYTDSHGVYTDLSEKLSSIYGEGIVDDDSDYFDTLVWKDVDGNRVRLLEGAVNEDAIGYVTLSYYAAGADTRLDQMQDAVNAEAAASEESERNKNKTNMEGL